MRFSSFENLKSNYPVTLQYADPCYHTVNCINRRPVREMRHLAKLLVILSLAACVGTGDPQGPAEPVDPVSPAENQKSPHGYVINANPGKFGGFIGDCTSDENFPFFWECMRENSGNGYN